MIGKIKYALHGVLTISYFHENTYTQMSVPLITCVINDTLLKTMPDIEQALLQFIDVGRPAAAFLPISCGQVGSDLCCWVPEVW